MNEEHLPPLAPWDYPRRILLAVTGLSPQVVTETLYALAVKSKPAFVPTEVHVVTTKEGAQRLRLTLLSSEPGWFRRFLQDFHLDGIAFDEDAIHVLTGDAGVDLDDIRSGADNQAAANLLTEQVRALTSDPLSALHVSIAGGRKTMGFFAGYALSLYGRAQDRLSHVLVTPPFESHPDFFYPTPYSRVIYTPPPDSRPQDTRAAEVTLAEIPFVRMRHGLAETLLSGTASFSETVAAAQRGLGPPELIVDAAARRITCAEQCIDLPPADHAFLIWFARRASKNLPPVYRTRITAEETHAYLAEYAALRDELSGELERVQAALAQGMAEDYFDQRRSRLHARLDQALGKRIAYDYYVHSDHNRPHSRYAMTLKPGQIRFDGVQRESTE